MQAFFYRLTSVLLALLAAGLAVAQTPTLDSEQWAFLALINNYRAQNGAGPLQVSIALQNSSQWMSGDMASKNYFSHTDSLGRDPFTRMAAFGYRYYPAGENIAAGYSDAQNTFNQWVNACDPDGSGACTYAHRKNMLSVGYTVIGIGRVNNPSSAYRWYWTTDFGGYVDQTITQGGGGGGGTPANVPPSADSVTPNSGSGTAQSFSATFSDGNGYADLTSVQILFSSTGGTASACSIQYNRSANTLALMNDAGTGWLTAIAPGSAGTASNSQCTMRGTGSAVTGAGNSLTLTVALSFSSAGAKTIYLAAQDKAGVTTTWQARGSWTVPGATNYAPTADSVSPNAGPIAAQTFRFAFSDANGYADLNSAQIVINSSLNVGNGCYLYFVRSANAVYLMNDAGSGWLRPITVGTDSSASNSQCSISGIGSSVSGSGNTLTLNLPMNFSPAYASAARNISMYVQDNAGAGSNWQLRGSLSAGSGSGGGSGGGTDPGTGSGGGSTRNQR